jgi:hypothetical protein
MIHATIRLMVSYKMLKITNIYFIMVELWWKGFFFTFKKNYTTFGNYIPRNNFFHQMPRSWSLSSCDPTPISAPKFPFTSELWWTLIHSIVDSPWSHINLLTFTSLPTFSACHARHLNLLTFTSLFTFGDCQTSHLFTTFASLPIFGACHACHLFITFASLSIFNTYHVNLLSPYLPSPLTYL